MNAPKLNEQSLVRLARSGDDQAFAGLVEAYAPTLYKVVRRVASDTAEAEAIVQEAFLRTWKMLPRYTEGRPFFPYLVTIALNIGRDQWREARRLDFGGLEEVAESLPTQEPGPETELERAETLRALSKAVAALPRAYRMVIALRYDAELSYEEIAEALKLPLNTVRTHLRRAKEALRKALVEYGEGVR
jgi:RNA polymerase sigma-70 factor (ECF subfamily)